MNNEYNPLTGVTIAGILATIGAFGIGAGIALGNWYGFGLACSATVFTALQVAALIGHALNLEE